MDITDIAIEPHWWWLILALILGIAEIVMPGFFLIWLAAAATVVGILTYAFDLPVVAQALIFAVAAVAAVYAGRRILKTNPVTSSDPLLNDRAARLIGETVLVVQAIDGGSGRVKVGDGVWSADGPDAPVGAQVRIIGARGTTLIVEPL